MKSAQTVMRAFLYALVLVVMITLPSAAQPRATPPSVRMDIGPAALATPTSSIEERIAALEERLKLSLAMKDERLEILAQRADITYKFLQIIGAVTAAVLVFFSVRDAIARSRERERQRTVDEIVKETLVHQRSSAQQQVQLGEQQIRVGSLQVANTEENLKRQLAAVQNVNEVIGVVRSTLAFRLEQERTVANTLKRVKRQDAQRARVKQHKLGQATTILDHFKRMSRMQFAMLTDEQYKRGLRLQSLVDDLEDLFNDNEYSVAGAMLYTCGVVAYYDNDVIQSKAYLDRAAQLRAADHEGELVANQDYRMRFAFTHYFRALIQKNWGDLAEAQHEIEESARLLEHRGGEFLTPVTRGEILSYVIGNEQRGRVVLDDLLQRMDHVELEAGKEGKSLDSNQLKLRNRMLLLCGNTYFVQPAGVEDALSRYRKALEFDPRDYYALASAARCERMLGLEVEANGHFTECLNLIDRSGDIRRKRERITRAVVATLAAQSANGCGDVGRFQQYAREAHELLDGDLTVDGMSPKFFSPSTKRLVSGEMLLRELDA